MQLISDNGRRVDVEELNTSRLLTHAKQQADARNFQDIMIVDVDSHHYESEHFGEILPFMENEVFKQLSSQNAGPANASMPAIIGYQDIGGRVTRYPLRASEKTEGKPHRDIQLGHRWMDAMSVDYACLFPTGMLNIAAHPQKEMEFELMWAYNRWVTEKVIPESDGRFYTMLGLPFNDAAIAAVA